MPAGQTKPLRVAIVGASSLLGKELKQLLEDCNFPATDIVLLDETPRVGTLTEAAGEPTFIRALEENSFEGAKFVFFAGSALDVERNWRAACRAGATVIDLTGALAESGHAAIAIPALKKILRLRPAGKGNGSAKAAAYSSPAAPVLIACTLAAAFHEFSPQRFALLFFRPVSERDQAGVDELESQTASLLSFRPIEQPVFDTQVAFALLAGYGKESKPSLEEVRGSIAREVATLLGGRVTIPAIQLVQAPVFYGYAFAAYAEFASRPAAEKLEKALARLGVKVGGPGEPRPTNVSVAGASEIHLARIEWDPNVAGGVWVWGGADNLRLAAANAVRIAEELLE